MAESMEMQDDDDTDDEESFLISLELMGGELTGETYSIIVRIMSIKPFFSLII